MRLMKNHFRPPMNRMNADKSFAFNPRLSAFIGGNRFGRLFHHPQACVGVVLKITTSTNGKYALTTTDSGDATYNSDTFAPFTLTVGTTLF